MLVSSYAGVRGREHGVPVTIAVPVEFADEALAKDVSEDLAVVEAALRETSFGGNEMPKSPGT
jgi:hypothetical protein